MISRRRLFATALSPALVVASAQQSAAARPLGVKKARITGVRTVEVRSVPTGKGLVLPWDASKTPRDTRDYVVTQLLTDQGVIGTTMDGDYRLRDGS